MEAQCVIVVTLTLHASIDTMLTDLADALRRQGVHCRMVVDVPQAPNLALLRGLVGELRNATGPRFLIDVNGKSDFPIGLPDGRSTSIHDAWDLPRLSFFESNPLHHQAHLAKAPQNVYATVVDASHLDSLQVLGVKTRGQCVCPHAGPVPLDRVPNTAQRDIPVLFMGNLAALLPYRDWLAQTGRNPIEQRILDQAYQAHYGRDGAGLAAVEAAAKIHSCPLPQDRRTALALAVEARANTEHRAQTLQALRSVPVHVLGEVHACHALPDNAVRVGAVSFANALGWMRRSRVLLNFMPFQDGAHERVFYGLSRGACSVTDPSSLLHDGAHPEEGGIIFRPSPDILDERIADLVADDVALDRRRQSGQAWYAAAHTWDHRAQTILDLMGFI